MQRLHLTLSALVPLFAPGALAGQITVGPAGSGADFDTLKDAVDAALPGDVVLVAPGEYPDVGTTLVDKPLTILGSGSEVTTVRAVAASPFDLPLPLRVTGLGPGEEVRVVGLSLESGTLVGPAAAAFVVDDCLGPVVLVDVACAGPTALFEVPAMAQVRDSTQVALDRCRLEVGASLTVEPTAALRVERSLVVVNQSVLRGGSAASQLVGFGEVDGAPGLVAVDSTVRLGRTTVFGGNGTASNPFFSPADLTAGGAAVVATTSSVFVRGGDGAALAGGSGGDLVVGTQLLAGPGGAAVECDAPSIVTATPDVSLAAGPDGDGLVTTAPVVGPGLFVPLTDPLATLGAAAGLVPPGGVVTLAQSGQPGATFVTWFALAQAPATALPGFLGELVLPIGGSQALGTTALDGAGTATLDVPVPNSSTLVGLSLVVQGLAVAPSATVSFSSPTFVGLR